MQELLEYVDGLPNLCGSEQLIETAIRSGRDQPGFLGRSSVDISGIDSAFAVALHMHQPLIPAGGPDLRTAAIVGNLQRPSGRWPLVSTSGDICSGGHGVPDYDELT